MIHVVLGMHKSGTTLISECLHHSGVVMVEAAHVEAGYDAGQKWEREASKALNQRMLGSSGVHSLAIGGARILRAGAGLETEMRRLVDTLSVTHTDWGFKDPRTCLTYEAWARVLPSHRVIGIYRDPSSVLAHYQQQAAADDRKFEARLVIARWCEYNLGMLQALRASGSAGLLLCYDEFMQGQVEFERLQTFLGCSLTDRRQPGLLRNRPVPLSGGWRTRVERLWQGGYRFGRVMRELERLRTA